jgi:hypothetical protein
LLGDDAYELGADLVALILARGQQLEAPTTHEQAIPVGSCLQRRHPDEAPAVAEHRHPELPPILRAEDAPPRQKPIGAQCRLVLVAALEQRCPLALAGLEARHVGHDLHIQHLFTLQTISSIVVIR